MKIRVPMLVLVSCGLLALVGASAYSELRKGHYQPATLGQLAQVNPNEGSPDSQYESGAYPLYRPELESGEGKTEVEGYCSMCHSVRYITMQPPLPAATWEAEVTKMKKTFGATIPDEATVKIIGYLQTHYTPETRAR
jgi:hypothetical protein